METFPKIEIFESAAAVEALLDVINEIEVKTETTIKNEPSESARQNQSEVEIISASTKSRSQGTSNNRGKEPLTQIKGSGKSEKPLKASRSKKAKSKTPSQDRLKEILRTLELRPPSTENCDIPQKQTNVIINSTRRITKLKQQVN